MTSKSSGFAIRKPVKYLTNKELLAEIAQCKKSYCSFVDEQYAKYDTIVHDLCDVTEELLEVVCARKSKEITPKGGDAVEVIPHGLIIRLMTYDHIPLDPDRKRKSRAANQTHAITTFPPFKHFLLEVEDGVNTFKEVGRSHWEGGMENGWFNPQKGKVSERMGMMYWLLVERYSKRGNWRNYCVSEDTEAFTQRGWLRHNEITERDKILAYDDGRLKWSKIKSIFRNHAYEGKMFHLTAKGMDALVTPNHRFITQHGLKPVQNLLSSDKLILMGSAVEAPEATYEDAFVEILGRAITDKDFYITKDIETKISTVAPDRILKMDFILDLSENQRELLINTMIDRISSQGESCIDMFVALCTLAGYRTFTQNNIVNLFSKGKNQVGTIDFHGGKRSHPRNRKNKMYVPNEPTVDYIGTVWCPATEYGTFIARRNGTVFALGNSYLDEMKSLALLQLSQVGLQFDESKSANPFAFYTTTVCNSFTRIYNLEKKNQNIRDDLLISMGAEPSYTRQIENELSQSGNIEPSVIPSKRGRRTAAQVHAQKESEKPVEE